MTKRGFGSNPFGGGGGSAPATSPNAFASGGGGGGGNQQRQRQRQRGGGSGRNRKKQDDAATDDNAFTDPLNTPAGDIAFQDMDTRQQGLTGMLSNAGVNFNAQTGGNQIDWLRPQMENWESDYVGNTLVDDPKATWEKYLYDLAPTGPGGEPTNPPPGTTPMENTGGVDFATWLGYTMPGKNQHWFRNLPKHRKQRIQDDYDTYVADLAAQKGAGGALDPGSAPWRQDVWGPAMLNRLTRDWQAATPLQRGFDSRSYRAPKRTVAF